MNQPERREVSALQKASVLEALKDPNGYYIHRKGRDYLRQLGFDPLAVVIEDLVDYLESGCRLYVLPDDPRKFHCCMSYEHNLVIHVKMAPSDEKGPFMVVLGFHAHNTGYPPLPC